MWERIEPYLALIRELPFVKGIAVKAIEQQDGLTRGDAILRIKTPKGWHTLDVETKGNPPNRVVLDHVLARRPDQDFLLLAPFVTVPLAQEIAARGGNFLDLAGNCHLAIGKEYLVHVEGRRPARAERRRRGLGAGGYQVLFAFLARPELLQATVREIAAAAGVGKTVAAETLRRLDEQDWIARKTLRGRTLLRPTAALLERWLTGYADVLRPKLLLGRYAGPIRDPFTLEKHIEKALKNERHWCFGGGAAAYRLTKHYRGEVTVLHLEEALPGVGQRLGMLPAEDGPLVVLRTPGPVAFAGPVPKVAHPVLVYTELLVAGGERAREAAEEVSKRYLGELPR